MTLAHERATEFLEGSRRQQRTIVTPEGVPVQVELADHGSEGALRRKSANVQLVYHGLVPRAAAPAPVAPNVGRRSDHLARPMHVFRLISRGRVRNA